MDFACQGCSLWHFPLAGLHFWGNQTSCFNNGGCEAAYLRTAFRVIWKHIETEHFPLAARPYIPAGSWTTSKCWLPTPTVRNGIMNMKIPKCSSRNSENCEVADTNKAQRMELCKMPGGLASRRARYLGTLNLRTNTPGYRMYQSTNQKLKVSYPSYPRASVREPDPNISWFTCGQRCGVMSSECLCTSPMPTFIRYKNSKMFISCIGLRHHAKMMVYDAKCTHSLRTKSEILLHPLAWYCAQTWATTKTATQLNAISTTPCLPGHHCVPSSLSMFKAWILGICLQVPHWHLGADSSMIFLLRRIWLKQCYSSKSQLLATATEKTARHTANKQVQAMPKTSKNMALIGGNWSSHIPRKNKLLVCSSTHCFSGSGSVHFGTIPER